MTLYFNIILSIPDFAMLGQTGTQTGNQLDGFKGTDVSDSSESSTPARTELEDTPPAEGPGATELMKHPQIAEPVSKVDAPAAVHSDAPAHDSQSRFREPDSQPPRTQEGGLPESDSQWPAEVMEEAQPELFVAQREEAGRRVESHQPAVEGLLAKGKPDAPSCEQPQTPSKEDLDSAEKREEDEDTKSDDLEKRQAFKVGRWKFFVGHACRHVVPAGQEALVPSA